jgi:preprotein translocase subunit SecE
VSDEKPGRGEDPRTASDAELTDEQLDREAPGVEDAAELEAAEDAIAAEAQAEEDKVVPTPARRRGGRITADDDEDDEPTAAARTRRPGGGSTASSRPAARSGEGAGTRSRAAAQRGRTDEVRRRDLRRFLREVVAELRKVIWPGRRELITYTTVVILFVAFMVALVAGLDVLFAQGVLAVFG